MFVKHSIKNVLRSSKKSVLFLILIIMIVVIMSIGMSLTVMIKDILNDCEENYTTVAKLEYMGVWYPEEGIYDSSVKEVLQTLDISELEKNPAVLSWDSTEYALGYTEGRMDINNLAMLKSYAVLVVKINNLKEGEQVYDGIVTQNLYSYENVQDMMIYINPMGFELTKGHYYLVNCRFYSGNSAYRHVTLSPFYNVTAENNGIDGSIENMLIDVTNEGGVGYTIPQDSYFYDIADSYAVINKCYNVQATNNIQALFPFQQSILDLTSGRYFTEEEYENGAKVCVMPEYLAQNLNLEIGDTFTINFAYESEAHQSGSYWAPAGFNNTIEYTLVGITNTDAEYKNSVFIPKTNDLNLSIANYSYSLGLFTLVNQNAEQFLEDVTPLLPDRVRLTIYDQGYTDMAKPLGDVMRIALIVTVAAGIVSVAITALFGFMFIYRQRESAKIMRRLGVENKNIYLYFLFGAGCIALIACVIGALISMSLSGVCVSLLENVVTNYTSSDFMYSNGRLSMIKTIGFETSLNFGVFAFTALGIFAVAMLSCFIFGTLSIKTHKHKHKTKTFGKARSHALNGGSMKYAWLSIKRGGFRTFIPIIVAVFAIILMFQMTFSTQTYEEKLQEIKESTEVGGYFTDIKGKYMNYLSVKATVINTLYHTDMIKEMHLSKFQYYWFIGVSEVNGVEVELPEFIFPKGFAYETFLDKVKSNANIVYTNHLESIPEFYYSSTIVTEFLDGYDSSFLADEVGDMPCCMVSTAFMEEKGVNLGDTIRITIYEEKFIFEDFLVVGSYVKPGSQDHIYCQLDYFVAESTLFGQTEASKLNIYFNSVSFKLTSGEILSDFKSVLNEQGYSEVNRLHSKRTFIVLEDREFLNTTSAISQRIWYMNNTFPVIYVLLEFIAGFAPFILVQMRKREIAMMRGQGANPNISFMSIFYEQLILCLTGAVLGIGGYLLVMKTITSLGLILGGVFVVCWLLGTAISINRINRCSVRSILKAEE